ncbi:hypothetical protein QBC33DRAFT_531838 [Phialemonium atrogriseum]|uniref:AMP-dependent synthetase/ligase domain-containing protein n=1 Tax=Phialemonium atrogriseum TaxID=1093897 RepID=A0AAJ0C5A6_9PEZI|nr:uncharacterized protein QBC33DRAFT_531838 [Phialemonium atrogriseum]KAK1769742.1 hypothetical protein QBC33DRAFT_531838 [Phialemonium atrogriseum]
MPYPSSFPPVSIPDLDLWTFLFERKDKPFPSSKEILTDAETGRTYTFSGLKHASHEFGKGLKARWGWKKGDVLALYTPNSIDSAVVTLGAIWAGGIVSPANPLYTVDELAFQLKDSSAKGLVTQRPFLETARKAAKSAGIPGNRIILIGDRRDETGKFRHFCSIRSTSYTGWYAKARIDPKKDLALLVYSSGTTGIPKGVCLSHHNIVANLVQYSYMDGRHYLPFGGIDGKGDKQLGAIPLFHIYGLVCCVLGPIFFGWQVVLMEKFDLEKALQTIQNYGLTFMYIPPPIVLAFGKHPLVDKYDLSTLKVLHSAAAPLTRELTEAVWERLKIPVKQGFGLSETSPICHIQSPDEWAKYIGSVGKLVPNMEAKIVDEDGNEVAEGEPGELWLKGPNVFQGYLNNPERTREAFSPCGYFKTGDIFSRDKWGNYYCVDRLKELIKYKGFPVPPAELEGLLITHKDVADVCVIGVEDKELATEVPRAYVVLSQGVEASEEKAKELAEWMAKKVAPHKKLRGGIRFVDQVPKSPSGKILRRILRDQVRKEERAAGPKL